MGVTIWTTTACNLKCTYCYVAQRNQKGYTINNFQSNIQEIIDWLSKSKLGNDRICFHGGEPLLNFAMIRDITDNLKKKNKLPKAMGFTTNGMIWNEQIEEFLIEYREMFAHDISISIDGLEKIHNKHRKTLDGQGSYSKVIKTQKKLLDIFPELRARMTITPDNVECFHDNIQHLVQLGFQNIAGSLDEYDKSWTEEDIEHLKKELIKVIDLWINHQELCLPLINDIRFRKPRGNCSFSYNIYPDGNIYPCIAVTGLQEFCIGNVKEGLSNEKINNLRQDINFDYEMCSNCSNKSYCIHNRCKFVNCTIDGKENMPSTLGCRIEALKFELEKKLAPFINYSTSS